MRNKKLTNSIIYLSILSIGFIFLISTVFLPKTEAQRRFRKKKIKPLVVLHDQNRPSLNYDGTRIISLPEIGLSEVFDVDTGKKLGSYRVKGSAYQAISANGKMVRIFDGDNQTAFEVDTDKMLSQYEIAVKKDGYRIAYLHLVTHGGGTSRNITSDLRIVAIKYANFDGNELKYDQPIIIVGDIEKRSVIKELYIDDGTVKGEHWDRTVITPDGKFVASSRLNYKNSKRNKTAIWDVETGKVIFNLPFHCHWMSLSADGSILVTNDGGDDRAPEFWDVQTGKKISTLSEVVKGKRDFPIGVGVLSPNGKILATSVTKDINFWDVQTGQFITSQNQSKYSHSISRSLTFSGDGKRIAAGSDTEVVTVWSVEDILSNAKFEYGDTITAE